MGAGEGGCTMVLTVFLRAKGTGLCPRSAGRATGIVPMSMLACAAATASSPSRLSTAARVRSGREGLDAGDLLASCACLLAS